MKKALPLSPSLSSSQALVADGDVPPRSGGSWSKNEQGEWVREGTVYADPFENAPQGAVEDNLKKD